MKIQQVVQDKKNYLDLLLLGDEEEKMIDRYLERSELFILYDTEPKCICAVTKEGEGVYEIKNIATREACQRKGYGKKLIRHIFSHYINDVKTLFVGTGDSSSAFTFYKKLGFTESHRIWNFFLTNYSRPIYDDGKQIIDMVYLRKTFK